MIDYASFAYLERLVTLSIARPYRNKAYQHFSKIIKFPEFSPIFIGISDNTPRKITF